MSPGPGATRTLNVIRRTIGVRDGGSGGAVDPPIRADITPQFGQIYDIYSGKRQHICLTNCVTPNGTVSIYLRYISGGLTKETFVGYSLRPSKTGTAIVHYYFFSLAGPRDKQVVFAIRAKPGLTPQMDVRPYAYASYPTPLQS